MLRFRNPAVLFVIGAMLVLGLAHSASATSTNQTASGSDFVLRDLQRGHGGSDSYSWMTLPTWSGLNHLAEFTYATNQKHGLSPVIIHVNNGSGDDKQKNLPSVFSVWEADSTEDSIDNLPVGNHSSEQDSAGVAHATSVAVPESSSLLDLSAVLLLSGVIWIQHRK